MSVVEGPVWEALALVGCLAPIAVLVVSTRPSPGEGAAGSEERWTTWQGLALVWLVLGLGLASQRAVAWDAPTWVVLGLFACIVVVSVRLFALAWQTRRTGPSGNQRSTPV